MNGYAGVGAVIPHMRTERRERGAAKDRLVREVARDPGRAAHEGAV